MTGWAIFNAVLSVIVFGVLGYKLLVLPDGFSFWERLGMGMIGGGCLLTIGPILWTEPTPYEEWAASLLRVGVAIYFISRMLKHHHANRAMVRQARQYKRDKAPQNP